LNHNIGNLRPGLAEATEKPGWFLLHDISTHSWRSES